MIVWRQFLSDFAEVWMGNRKMGAQSGGIERSCTRLSVAWPTSATCNMSWCRSGSSECYGRPMYEWSSWFSEKFPTRISRKHAKRVKFDDSSSISVNLSLCWTHFCITVLLLTFHRPSAVERIDICTLHDPDSAMNSLHECKESLQKESFLTIVGRCLSWTYFCTTTADWTVERVHLDRLESILVRFRWDFAERWENRRRIRSNWGEIAQVWNCTLLAYFCTKVGTLQAVWNKPKQWENKKIACWSHAVTQNSDSTSPVGIDTKFGKHEPLIIDQRMKNSNEDFVLYFRTKAKRGQEPSINNS